MQKIFAWKWAKINVSSGNLKNKFHPVDLGQQSIYLSILSWYHSHQQSELVLTGCQHLSLETASLS